VKRRGSSGFHQRDFSRATVGLRQSYGTPRNVPVFDRFAIADILSRHFKRDSRSQC